MNQVPKASSGLETKRFWSKIKQSSKGLSSSLGNLSIHSEHDGSTETDTVIHKALVNYYQTRQMSFPEWLGVPDRSAAPSSARSTNDVNNRYQSYQSRSADSTSNQQQSQRPTPTTSHSSSSSLSTRRTLENSKYSLSDIYSRSSSSSRTTPQPQLQPRTQQLQPGYSRHEQASYGRAPISSGPTNGGIVDTNGGASSAGYSGSRINSTASNRLKERAQRHNKQTFESQGSTSAPSYSSSGTSRSAATWRRN